MIWAAATICFFGFLRAGEVVAPAHGSFDPTRHLTYADIRIDNSTCPRMVEVRIKASKTDPFRRGISVNFGWTENDLCPVAAALDYMVRRGASGGSLFQFEDARYLTRERFVAAVREALRTSGVDPSRYAGHSFRIGAATTATQRGIDSLIKALGRWESAAYTVYIRTPRKTLCEVARTLVREDRGNE